MNEEKKLNQLILIEIIKLRKSKKLTQKYMSEQLNMSRVNYCHIERGNHNTNIEQFLKILNILKPDVVNDLKKMLS